MLGFTRGEQTVLLLIVAAILVGSAALIYVHATQPAPEPLLSQPQAASRALKVVVCVSGAVRKPGVYTLPSGARVNDAIRQAGGANADANLETLNLAAVLRDGEKIEVPIKGANPAPAVTAPEQPATGEPGRPHSVSGDRRATRAAPTLRPGQMISLNTASALQLEALPGIGPAYAERIVQLRRQLRAANGKGFTSIEQLMQVPGIGPKRFRQVRPYVGL